MQSVEAAADASFDGAKWEAELFCDCSVCLPIEKSKPDHVALFDRQPLDCATNMLGVGGLCDFVAGVSAVVVAFLTE